MNKQQPNNMQSLNIFTLALVVQLVAFCSAFNSEDIFKFSIHPELNVPNDGVETIAVDNTHDLGRRFQGIGAISGGGATSKLLANYEEPRRNEILDFLFKPNFGASLQILKVEIGGDVQSTDGTEASHMHTAFEGIGNFFRGYEWWLMKEAKKRNPDIKLYGLPWGFPGWLGNGTDNPYINPAQTAEYVVKWVDGAKAFHNLDIDYIGIWNERKYSVTYIKTLRRMLDESGWNNTLIVAADNKWGITKDLLKDKELAAIVHAIGCHYPGTWSTKQAVKTGKHLWASEDYSTFNSEIGGGCWARILNQNYVNGLMTSTISWNLVSSYYQNLPFYRDGLMTADQPWSGNYNVSTPIWMTAHTTQFVPIGWRYLGHNYGVGRLAKGGSYVSLTNDDADQLTIVIETMTHDHSVCIRPKLPHYEVTPQTIRLKLQGAFTKINQMNVWYSKLKFDGSEHQLFEKKDPLVFTDGEADLKLGLDEIITLTTQTTGHKGSHPTPPAPRPFPQIVVDIFTGYEQSNEPAYLSPQIGSLEVVEMTNGRSVARQTVIERPVYWCRTRTEYVNKTISIVGDNNWADMNMSTGFTIPSKNGAKGAFVAVRVDRGGCQANMAEGIFFFILPESNSYVVSTDLARINVLKQGHLPTVTGKTGMYRISLQVRKGKVVGQLDYKDLFSMDAPKQPTNGWGAIGTDSFGHADFDYFLLRGPEVI